MKPCFVALFARGLVLATVYFSNTRLTHADQVEMQNGDRYNGKVLSLNEDSLILQNEVLGKITLPRAKIVLINLGALSDKTHATPLATNRTSKFIPPTQTNSLAAQLNANPQVIQQVQKQFLAGADPAAQDKFNELVSGLLSGKLDVQDIRREAKSAADQMRALKKDAGEDASFAIEGYLAILDQFLKEVPETTTARTNAPAAKQKSTRAEEE
jgi:hypothetical protein